MSIEYANQAIKFSKQSNNYETHVKAVANLGTSYCYKGDYLQAKKASLHAIQLAKKYQWKTGEVIALESMGRCSKEISDFETALDYYNQALKITLNENVTDIGTLMSVYGNMAGLYALLEQWDKAISYYHKTEEMAKNDIYNSMVSYVNLAYSYVNKGEYTIGENYARKLVVK